MIARISSAPRGKPYRVSSDAAWPLRGADGLTFAERKARQSITEGARA